MLLFETCLLSLIFFVTSLIRLNLAQSDFKRCSCLFTLSNNAISYVYQKDLTFEIYGADCNPADMSMSTFCKNSCRSRVDRYVIDNTKEICATLEPHFDDKHQNTTVTFAHQIKRVYSVDCVGDMWQHVNIEYSPHSQLNPFKCFLPPRPPEPICNCSYILRHDTITYTYDHFVYEMPKQDACYDVDNNYCIQTCHINVENYLRQNKSLVCSSLQLADFYAQNNHPMNVMIGRKYSTCVGWTEGSPYQDDLGILNCYVPTTPVPTTTKPPPVQCNCSIHYKKADWNSTQLYPNSDATIIAGRSLEICKPVCSNHAGKKIDP